MAGICTSYTQSQHWIQNQHHVSLSCIRRLQKYGGGGTLCISFATFDLQADFQKGEMVRTPKNAVNWNEINVKVQETEKANGLEIKSWWFQTN